MHFRTPETLNHSGDTPVQLQDVTGATINNP